MSKQDIPIIGPFLNRIIGTRNDRFVKKYLARARAINDLEPSVRALTDAQIRARFLELRGRVDKGEKAVDLMVEAFAVAREAMDRAVGIRSIFNPKHGFDPAALPAAARELYQQTKAEMDARPPAPAEGEFLGCPEPQPGWMQVDIPVELYEAVRALLPESRPPFRARPFDVQLIGAMVLYQGKISEMKTGEGKTIVAPLACYLAAIERMKVHVVTVNDYLVQRDRDWTFPYFHALGLTVGAIHPVHMQSEDAKRQMYRCDVVYGTTAEFGFDYLRDNMKRTAEQQVQRNRHFAIVDEVDSILIDEARTPLIISGPAHEGKPRYDLSDRLARHLLDRQAPWQAADNAIEEAKKLIKGLEGDIRNTRDRAKVPEFQARIAETKARLPKLEADRASHTQFYELQMDRKQCHLTHHGIAEAQRVAGIGSFYVGENMDVPHLLEQSLRAHAVYQRDRDYVIMPAENPQSGRMEPAVVIVDVFTGRPMVGRQWSDGLHQAIEAKESVPIKQETQTVATITIQNFFKMYRRLAGMTGTADTEAQEFHDIYRLDVVAIPTNRPVVRRDFDDLVFLTAKDKWAQIVDEIKAFHDIGRPVLVGTTSVEKSETLSRMLQQKHAIKHEVLNAKQHEREAHVIENAGALGAVMIATNMAGRGTDIKLAPITREALLDHWLRRGICPRTVTTASTTSELREGVYRKLAPQELGLPRHEVEQMPFARLEADLLRHWAKTHTWESDKALAAMNAEQLRAALDAQGRFLMHRIDWFDTIESMGGLHVAGTERHESRRIDNQLRGRSGRQGDKGSTRFFISLEDDLMKLFAGDTTMKILARLGMKEGDAIEHPILSKSVERAQRKVEERNFQIRKQLLDYDEVMEHQRQAFYGLRQRVLEGRDMRGLISDYIRDSVEDAVAEYVSPKFVARCVSDHVAQVLDCTITPERLAGKDREEIIRHVRREAREDYRAMIGVTLGEYLPVEGDGPSIDLDAEGLAKWAHERFQIELDPQRLRPGGDDARQYAEETLAAAADARIDAADLAGIDEFLAPGYGYQRLAHWAKTKFDIDLDPADLAAAGAEGPANVRDAITRKTDEVYHKREIEYPVEFAMDMTLAMMRQSPQAAASQLVRWANTRFKLGWTEQTLMATGPTKARDELFKASRAFYEDGVLEKEVQAATACRTDEALDAHFQERFGFGLPETMRYLKPDERPNAIRARVESVLRAELLYFERTILLEILDSAWKDHLYGMDQLRDGISFRAFSQQDPRIEYKREGSKNFNQMMQNVRDRVTDYIFKVKLTPQAPPPPAPAQARPPAPIAPDANGGAPAARRSGSFMSSISGPGVDAPPQYTVNPPKPPSSPPSSTNPNADQA
ncbi:MAG: preprotein translocase subunit SecA [Phycisphaerae bacterium]|nr:preprotein translocase subunit SecA [Phycisphaerae bacterium]